MKKLLLLLVSFFTASLFAQDAEPSKPESYMRVDRSKEHVKLQIAARKMVPDGREGPTIWLTGVAHLGEEAYFKQLQKHLDEPELVLYEGVGDSPRMMKRMGMKQPKGVQDQMAEALGMAFQLEVVDYERKHFENCDVSVEQLQAMMQIMAAESEEGKDAQEELKSLMSMLQGEGVMSAITEGLLNWLKQNPQLQNTVKLMFIEVLGNLQGDLTDASVPPEMLKLMELLIDERNKIVLKKLQKELFAPNPPQSVSVFYGAGHMHDLEERLVDELGYKADEEIWFDAMSLDLKKAGLRSTDVALIRRLADMQLKAAQ